MVAMVAGPLAAAADAQTSGARLALLDEAEAAMTRGDTTAAIAAFDRAAMMLHAADTEMGLVRAYLQQGEYRRALAFAAHVAGAHRDAPSAAALYAWLLSIGGQGAFAQRLMEKAQSRAPSDPVLAETRQRLASAGVAPTPALLDTPHRMAPHGVTLAGEPPVPASARVVSNGVLLNDGLHALLPLASCMDHQGPLWVRDGMGHNRGARIERRIETLGLALATLSVPLEQGHAPPASRDPYGGSPGYVVAFAVANDANPAWPWLHAGFVGSAGAVASSHRRLGIDVPASVNGAPVFDAAGSWSGIALRQSNGGHVLLPIQRLRDELGGVLGTGADVSGPTARITPDVVYERSMRVALQVICVVPAAAD